VVRSPSRRLRSSIPAGRPRFSQLKKHERSESGTRTYPYGVYEVYCVFLVEMRVDRLGYEVLNQTQDVQSTVAVAAAACDWPTYEVDQSDTSCIEHCCRCTGGM
jgi:hypothetical protein